MSAIGIDITDLIGSLLPPLRGEDEHSILCTGDGAALFLEDWAKDIRTAAGQAPEEEPLVFRVVLGQCNKGRTILIEHYHETYTAQKVRQTLSQVRNERK